jgi:hypothetical protein
LAPAILTGRRFSFAEKKIMRSKLRLLAILAIASAAYAKDPKAYQSGKLMQMDSVSCGIAEKDGKSFAGEVLGTDSGSKKTQEVLCQEYVLQAERVIYRGVHDTAVRQHGGRCDSGPAESSAIVQLKSSTLKLKMARVKIRAVIGDDIDFNGGAHNNLRVTFGPQVRF